VIGATGLASLRARLSFPRERLSPPRERLSPPCERLSPPRERLSPPREKLSPPREKLSPPRRRGPSDGFTLIEILVAVAILAIALAATSRAASVATDGAMETRQRLLATWAAQNRVAELRARRLFPPPATTRLAAEQAGLALVIEETVSETPNPTIRKVEIAVARADVPARVVTRLVAYVAQ
jgi:general secretion pathway protein I